MPAPSISSLLILRTYHRFPERNTIVTAKTISRPLSLLLQNKNKLLLNEKKKEEKTKGASRIQNKNMKILFTKTKQYTISSMLSDLIVSVYHIISNNIIKYY